MDDLPRNRDTHFHHLRRTLLVIALIPLVLLLYQRYPKSRLFMMSMFIMVAYLE